MRNSLCLLFLGFLLLCANTSLQAQNKTALLKAAKDTLLAREITYSKKHLQYQLAALDYAALIYLDDMQWEEADQYAAPALLFIAKNLGRNSTVYSDNLKKIPTAVARRIDINNRIALLPKKSSTKVQRLLFEIERIAVLIELDEDDPYELITKLYQQLEKLPKEESTPLYKAANKQLPRFLTTTILLDLKRKKTSPETTAYIDVTIKLIEAFLPHTSKSNMDYSEIDVYDLLFPLSQLAIRLGDQQRLHKIQQFFNPEMKKLYQLHKDYVDVLVQPAVNDDLIFKFRSLITFVDNSYVTNMSSSDLCPELVDTVEARLGVDSDYYKIVTSICTDFDADAVANANAGIIDPYEYLETQELLTKDIRKKEGSYSEKYANQLLILAAAYVEMGDELEALEAYQAVFEIFEDLDFDASLDLDWDDDDDLDLSDFDLDLEDDDLDLNLDDDLDSLGWNDEDLDLDFDLEDLDLDLDLDDEDLDLDDLDLDLDLDDEDLDLDFDLDDLDWDDEDLDLDLDDLNLDLDSLGFESSATTMPDTSSPTVQPIITEVVPTEDTPKNNTAETFVKKFFRIVPEPWVSFVRNENNIQALEYQQKDNHIDLYTAYLEAGLSYFEYEILIEEKAKPYYQIALESMSEQNEAIVIDYVNKLFKVDPEYAPIEMQDIFLDNLPLYGLLTLLEGPLDSMQQQYGEKSLEALIVKRFQAHAYFIHQDNPANAQKALDGYRQLLPDIEGVEGIEYEYLETLEQITDNIIKYKSPWHLETDLAFFELLNSSLKNSTTTGYINYAKFLKKYANWHYEAGRYIAAEPLYEQYFAIYDDPSKSYRDLSYSESLYNIARIYRKTGRYSSSLNMYQRALDLELQMQKKKKRKLPLIRIYNDLGLLYQQSKIYSQALVYFEKAQEELLTLDNRRNGRFQSLKGALMYIKIVRNIGRIALDQKDYELAMSYYNKVKAFEKTSTFVSFNRDHSLMRDLALLYDQTEEDEKARRYYSLVIKKLRDKDELADALISFANFYETRDSIHLAKMHYLAAIDLDANMIKSNYPNLSEEERLLFLKPINKRVNQFLSFVTKNPDSTLLIRALNLHLTIKGLSLENTNNIKDAIVNSENVLLKEWNDELLLLRKKMAKAATLSTAKRKMNNIDVSKLGRQIKELERKLSRESKALRNAFDKQNQELNFEQLQGLLAADEAAIDFLTVRQQNEYEEQVLQYYALVIRADAPAPILVKLADQTEMGYVLDNEVAPNTINYITDPLESHYLYELAWMPLEKHLKDIKILRLSPTGVLSKVSFSTLLMQDYGNQRIMDKWSLHYYSSFRDMLRPSKANLTNKIALVGGVEFSLNDQQLAAIAKRQKLSKADEKELLRPVVHSIATQKSGSRGEDFSYLPGTLQEVNAIAAIFEQNNWSATVLSGTNALEENVDTLDLQTPDILHIATHGFFFATQHKDDNENLLSMKKPGTSVEDIIATNKDPLLRSGLAMTGINVIWKDGKQIAGMEDGILFAKEVAGMNLFETELVVLSACETGRGDIDNDEGIMGLQRAFKTAGAHQLIISYWKVPDQQTSELMQLFYTNYLATNDAHASFEKAQHIMKKRYRNPYYWAAFVLIE